MTVTAATDPLPRTAGRTVRIGPTPDRRPPAHESAIPADPARTGRAPRPGRARGSAVTLATVAPVTRIPSTPRRVLPPAAPRGTATAPTSQGAPRPTVVPLRSGRAPLRAIAGPPGAFSPRPTSRALLPDPTRWAATLSITALQVVAGARSPGQLAKFATPEVVDSLTRRQGHAGRARRAAGLASRPVSGPTAGPAAGARVGALRPTRVRAVVLSEPRDGIVDASVVVDDGRRVRAIALRLTGLDGRWVLTELQIG